MRPASFTFGTLIFAFILLFSSSALAQMNGFQGHIASRGVPAGVTSFGFGGHPGFHGVPASVTATGFGARSGFRGVPPSANSLGFGEFHHGISERPFGFRHRRHDFFGFYSPFYGGYYVPYASPYYFSDDEYPGDAPAYDAQAARDYREYDDRRILNDDYRSELNSSREQQQPQAAAEPVADQPSTVLVFKDGHQVEIANYAIVGPTLYDLTDGRTKKVQLADLDLPATVKENDNRGVEFQLPTGLQLN